ncbi:sure-like protein [Panus rudis PR-1116 ss-1]|nr:sure-like protein [Panus rudis PR-1116 ss-1]
MTTSVLLTQLVLGVLAQTIILTNDDGWAVAHVRAQFDALDDAGYDVVLSAPTENKSGTGSSSATPTPLTQPCQFNTCPTGSPAEGHNASNPRLNWVNAFPVDSVRYGIQTLAPQFFGSKPDFVVSGPNVGTNLGNVNGSGTVGAACEAAIEGIPSTAFSGSTGSQVSYTTLTTQPTSLNTIAARIYSQLTVQYLNALLSSSESSSSPGTEPILPPNISVNVNYASISGNGCTDVKNWKFVATRLRPDSSAMDAQTWTCGRDHLPDETSVNRSGGCWVSVSVMDARSKGDVGAEVQGIVFGRLESGGLVFSCFE